MIPDMDNVPQFIADTLAADPDFAAAGLRVFNPEQPNHGSGIVIHDFSTGAKLGQEMALERPGLCFVITPFDDAKGTDQIRGAAALLLNFTLHAQEIPGVNRNVHGTRIRCDKAIIMAARSLLRAQWPGNFPRSLVLGTIRNLGDQNGVWACTVTVGIPIQLP